MKDEKDRAKYIKDFYEQCDFSELIVNCDDQEEYHWQSIARILFIYAKLNPGQGMVFIFVLLFTSCTTNLISDHTSTIVCPLRIAFVYTD